jgi:probable Rubsico expression protein CbbX
MSGLTQRNLIAALIAIATLIVSSLAWFYIPLVVFPLIPLAGFFGMAVYLSLNPVSPVAVQTAAGRPAAVRRPAAAGGGAAAASGPAGVRLAAASSPAPGGWRPARDAPSRQAARGTGRRSGQPAPLPRDAVVDLGEERQAAGVEGVLADLDRKLVGLAPVKTKVDQIASLLMVDRARQRFGLEAPRPNLHMCFTGEPGTGKTTVALKMAELLYRLGYLDSAKLVHAMRDDLVGEYIGQTAPKTKWVLERAMGGVLFIDEAYSLFRPADPKDYGQECIDILLQVMENDRDKLVVILAGYKDRMDVFFDSNPGMSSRVAHHLDFAPYTLDELVTIGQLMLADSSYYLSDQAETTLREQLDTRMREPRFANARTVRNDLERARLNHAHRLASDTDTGKTLDELMRLESADILITGAAG